LGYPQASTCGNATAVTAPGVTTGRMLGETQQWFAVTFPNDTGKCGKVYTIQLVPNGTPVVMNVNQNCTGTGVACNAAGDAASNYMVWEFNDNGLDCTQQYPLTFYVQVLSLGSGPTCMDYSIVAFAQ
jgi:hypothetical protein